jgi:L-glyceraldehyde 3-phosphate reductase
MMALDHIVRSGRALYAGISSYSPEDSEKAIKILHDLGTPCLVHQPSYNMFDRWVEDGLLDVLEKYGVGSVVFSPLFQGLLTDKYLKGIPEGSRAAKSHGFLQSSQITKDKIEKVRALNEIAIARGQKMAQLALNWVLRDERVTSVIIGASKVSQIEDAVRVVQQPTLSAEELGRIDSILGS